jgi:hypothetical protein
MLKFHWNLIRLGFCFADICGDMPVSLDVHSTNGTTPDLSWLNAVIDLCNENGLKVVLAEFTFTGSSPDTTVEATTFTADWGLLAKYEKGNPGIAMYEVANEIEDSSFINTNYGSLDGYLLNVTNAIRGYQPDVTVAWGQGFNHAALPFSPTTSDLYQDVHFASYMYNSSGDWDGCVVQQNFNSEVKGFVTDYGLYGVPTLNGEIDAEEVAGEPMTNGHPICDVQADQWITQMMANGIPYIVWGYSLFRSNWDYILNSTSFVQAPGA